MITNVHFKYCGGKLTLCLWVMCLSPTVSTTFLLEMLWTLRFFLFKIYYESILAFSTKLFKTFFYFFCHFFLNFLFLQLALVGFQL